MTTNGFGIQSLAAPGDAAMGLLSSPSDSFSIWVDGEEHCISGVDSSTTCADLICALISYQTAQQHVLSKEEVLAPQQFAIVHKQRHYEEYLDSSARLIDVITSLHAMPKEEYQLQLRHLATSNRKQIPTTDKDSGMGSPVDSSRSMRFRRRGKHKVLPSTNTTDNINTKQSKRSRKLQQRNDHLTPNESLLTIILAQDETILQQMTMLHEKDRQILKIEEEKHRVRERELGKNYLLETYLKDLDEPQEKNQDIEYFKEKPQEIPEDPNFEAMSVMDQNRDLSRAFRTALNSDTGQDEIRVYWLEKIHAVNKQLQCEEELLLSLHSKVRRHQVKRAYQTKSEVLLQIERLDTELAAQVADIHHVERKLFTANEQLKAKLAVLECLSREFETTVSGGVQEGAIAIASKAVAKAQLSQSSSSHSDDPQPPGNWLHVVKKLFVADHPNPRLTQQPLNDKNLSDRLIPDKGISKQMFEVLRSPDPTTSTSVQRKEFASRQVISPASERDIQHLGTLV
ncbi:uncharacterized protein LOC6544641 [Drosophila erecta]|uniref:Uncharacterized protein, isoform A n=1 Tax=Drosophila erecta TaxID=7220 RepID=B3NEK7_DROER|nr:uncharacterized protein LOC6544641 [Drosophila erecta]XP_026833777.1 uncharacterized protein LOC6544641 [Drosophila erecta]XP_026833778.1 uncharacterized protein LOC6544641 [Drosophila erecta]XP_026833779.1 uncharacterized protein LOC6544641 [Drosophila erecta]XP_026833780.1 uncharacterized protein LOC6544641 [Drosophila erecta]EDV50002.1 uncharacterized protein Dere_GG14696, isoform A [Drosophila erecta]KQS43000.1 uncharacterized protein Dere_GG14696, isoform B [Drosophila erecta]